MHVAASRYPIPAATALRQALVAETAPTDATARAEAIRTAARARHVAGEIDAHELAAWEVHATELVLGQDGDLLRGPIPAGWSTPTQIGLRLGVSAHRVGMAITELGLRQSGPLARPRILERHGPPIVAWTTCARSRPAGLALTAAHRRLPVSDGQRKQWFQLHPRRMFIPSPAPTAGSKEDPMSNENALQAALKGGKVSERQTKSALSAAVTKIAGLTKRAQRGREAMAETATAVVHTAETTGSLFLASLAEGYFGPDRLKVGSVDLRAPVGVAALGYGLYETMSGKNTGGHALALGNGVLGSWLASVATQAGRTLAEKRTPAPEPAFHLTPALQGPAFPEPDLQGPLREVLLTPEDGLEGDWPPRRRQRPLADRLPRRRRARRDEAFDPDNNTEEV